MSWFVGNWWGSSTGGGGTTDPVYPVLAVATTPESVRDRIIAVIEGLSPTSFTRDRFRHYRNEGKAGFQDWAEANAAGCRRRFQVRDTGDDDPPAVSNTDVEQREITFSILISYPQSGRDGHDQALDRDDSMKEDQLQLERQVGMTGRANFISPYPDAVWTRGNTRRIVGGSCDFLEITQTMTFMVQQR